MSKDFFSSTNLRAFPIFLLLFSWEDLFFRHKIVYNYMNYVPPPKKKKKKKEEEEKKQKEKGIYD